MNSQKNGSTRKNSVHGAVGFSLIELLAALSTMAAVLTTAVVQLQPALQRMRSSNAAYVVFCQLRFARQSAIAQRRAIKVEFLATREIKLTREDLPGPGTTVISDIFLNRDVSYQLTPGLPDSPDGFGNGGPIVFGGIVGGPPIMKFQSDGTFIDGTGNPINGTVFLGIPNVPVAARAITVLGATGRVRSYRPRGTQWIR